MRIEEYFAGRPVARRLYRAVKETIETIGRAEVHVSKSQIAFRRERAFAWVWRPDRYLRGSRTAPLVLSIALHRRDPCPRWKEVVEPAPGRFMHHLELHEGDGIDPQVRAWLAEAWRHAG